MPDEMEELEEQEEEEEEQIDPKKIVIAVVLFIVTLILGYFAFVSFDYFDNINQRRAALHKINVIKKSLDNPNPIPVTVLEDFEFDLSQIKTDVSTRKGVKKELESALAKLQNHLALVPTGSYIKSWSTSELVRAEIDTLKVPYKDRAKYLVKTVYLPVTAAENRAWELLMSHPDWGKDECLSIANRKVWVGMTKEKLLLSRGQPQHIDKNYSSTVNNEQWSYGNFGPYFYLDNGKLTSWQE
jgi:hypothetical protein